MHANFAIAATNIPVKVHLLSKDHVILQFLTTTPLLWGMKLFHSK